MPGLVGIRSRARLVLAALAATLLLAAPRAADAVTVELNILYVHGVDNCTSERQNAHNSLADLASAVDAALPAQIAAFQAAHPGVALVTHSARANLYTATPSGFHPSDSTDPLLMDDWEVGDPGCSTTRQGDPCTTAYEWRYRLAGEINRLFPAPARNIILVGHSSGARAAMEVASNTGPDGVGTFDWGVSNRIAGVVTVHGMIDAIGTSTYNFVGPTSFETGCKNGDAVLAFGNACAPGNGWCEYAGRVDGKNAADWVAANKRAMMLTSWGSCSPSAWTGQNDGSLPYDAQGSPLAVGLDMTPSAGQTYRPAHGERYGDFCHSAITNASNGSHAAARDAARQRIVDWLFTAAPRVAAAGTNTTATSIGFNQFSSTFTMGSSCPVGEVDDGLTSGTEGLGIDVVGVCKHPGFFDGDDHPVAQSEITVQSNGATCNGSYRWQQAHDSDNNHAASFWWKTRSLYADGPDLVDHLAASALGACGNGQLDAGEACDDGNTVGGDCCTPTCEHVAAGTACASDGNPCTLDECDGVAATCQHPAGNAGALCRAEAGVCDVAETCTGTSAACPADGFASSTVSCRPSAGVCDVAESCTGSSAACPADAFKPSTTPCRASAGVCDIAESCTGAAAPCPSDAKSTAECRAAAGVCDVAEVCDGTSNDCPANAFAPSTQECRAAAGACDAAETCTGSGVACPIDASRPDGTPCDDGLACTIDDTCVGGTCGGDSMTCGDGVQQASCGEQCDDGNLTSGDGCSATCQTEFVCEPAPRVGCKRPIGPGAAKIRLMDKVTDASDAIGWTWTKGAATTFAELGTPPTATDYLLCIYDDVRGLAMSARVPADQSCAGSGCSTATSSGLKYKDKAATPDGVTALSLKIGVAGKSKIILKGKGEPLPMPALPLGQTVTVQLRNAAGTCWEAVYGAPQRNDPTRYQAKSD
jgi:cysteine-rich repeat protein